MLANKNKRKIFFLCLLRFENFKNYEEFYEAKLHVFAELINLINKGEFFVRRFLRYFRNEFLRIFNLLRRIFLNFSRIF